MGSGITRASGSRTRVYPRADLALGRVALGVVAQTWPLQVLTAGLLLAATWWFLVTGDEVLLRLAGRVEAYAAIGLGAAFALHEVAHAAVLRRCRGVSHVLVTVTPWRFSLEPRGTMSPGQLFLVALAGPGAVVAAGLVLRMTVPQLGLHWWFLAHLVFLLPVFGDGRSLLAALGRLGRPAARRTRAVRGPS